MEFPHFQNHLPKVMSSMFINDLPKYIAREIFNNWLTVQNVGIFDKAVCNSIERPRSLNHIEDINIHGLNDNYASQGYLKWISSRKIKIHDLTLKNDCTVFKSSRNVPDCLKHLQVLDIDSTEWTTVSGFDLSIKRCLNLTDLRLIASDILANDKTIRLFADNCPKLNIIHLDFENWSKQLTNSSFIYLARKCPLLRSVYVGNFAMSQKCFEAFVNGCSELSEFSYTAVESDNVPSELTAIAATHTVTGVYLSPDCIGLDFDCTNTASKLSNVNMMEEITYRASDTIELLAEGTAKDTVREITLMDLNGYYCIHEYEQLMATLLCFTNLQKFNMMLSNTRQRIYCTAPLPFRYASKDVQNSLISFSYVYAQSAQLAEEVHEILTTFPNLTDLTIYNLGVSVVSSGISRIIQELCTRSIFVKLHCVSSIARNLKDKMGIVVDEQQKEGRKVEVKVASFCIDIVCNNWSA